MDNKWAMELNWNLRKEMNNKWVMEVNWIHAINTLNNSKIEPIQTKKKRQKMLTQTIEQNNLKS